MLNGIKVLDLSRLLPGPLCSWYLRELGAEVIKIEPPEGDYARAISPEVYQQLNRGKKIIQLNLKEQTDRERFLEMVKGARVVIESFRPNVTRELGVDFETLKKINPQLVYCSITGFGQDGPLKDEPGHDMNYLSYAGILHQMKGLSNFQIADLAGGSLSSCIGILAGLIGNQAAHVDISMLDCTMALNQVALATYRKNGQDIPAGHDLLNGGFPFYETYETSDRRQFALAALEFKFWKNFCKAIGKSDWEPWHSAKASDYPEIRNELASLFKSKTLTEWVVMLEGTECCGSPVLSLSEAHLHPHIQARGLIREDMYQFPIKFKK